MADLSTTITNILNKLKTVEQGQASSFRKQINDNFFGEDGKGGVKGAILSLSENLSGESLNIQVSKNQPSGQKSGDFWFKEL